MLLSLAFVASILTFFTQIAHPVTNLWAAPRMGGMAASSGITGFVLTSAILTGPLLLLLRYDRLPAGATTVVVGLNVAAMGFLHGHGAYPRAIVVAIVGAVIAVDLLRLVVRPEASRPRAFRSFAIVVAAAPVLAYFVTLAGTRGITWSTHVWVGVIVFTGGVGWLLSYVVLPPRLE